MKIHVNGKEWFVPDGIYCTDVGVSICDSDWFKHCNMFKVDLATKIINDNNFHYRICIKCIACLEAEIKEDK